MTIRLYRELPLENPVFTPGWPGSGDVWTITIDTMRETPEAEELDELEHHYLFYAITSLDPLERVRIPLAR
jgi:proteasome assembly chaperone (PAC2) family protein